jgi:hypothetical protein
LEVLDPGGTGTQNHKGADKCDKWHNMIRLCK